jgi:hypothetical protein
MCEAHGIVHALKLSPIIFEIFARDDENPNKISGFDPAGLDVAGDVVDAADDDKGDVA